MNAQLPGSTIDTFLYRNGRYWPRTGKQLSLSYSIDRSTSARLSDRHAQAIEEALNQWRKVANINFRPVSTAGNLRFSGVRGGDNFAEDTRIENSQALDYVDIVLNKQHSNVQGNRFLFVALHEIGHALGLKHPGNYNGLTEPGLWPFLPYAEDNPTNTVMTYNAGLIDAASVLSQQKSVAYAVTPMPYDIAAIQALYGARRTNQGNNRYRFSQVYSYNNKGIKRPARSTIWDSAGTDTVDFSALDDSVSVYYFDINPGGILTEFSAFNTLPYQPIDNVQNTENLRYLTSEYGTGIAYGTILENLVGSRSRDVIYGNAAANYLKGNAGGDIINGADGNDIIHGDAGVDQLSGQNGRDLVRGGMGGDFLFGGDGNDRLLGDAGDDSLYGDAGRDTLEGGKGNDRLEGGNGNDRLIGGSGDDTYIVENLGDRIIEAENSGLDTVYTSVNTTLSANIEVLTLTGKARRGRGNKLDNIITGNDNNNRLEGFGGDDRLVGGKGRDYLTGGRGADQFEFDTLDGGIDRITDFNRREGDKIQFAASLFENLVDNTITTDMFVLGTTSLDNNDYILYDQATGRLAFDGDGVGNRKAVTVAILAGRAELTVSDLGIG